MNIVNQFPIVGMFSKRYRFYSEKRKEYYSRNNEIRNRVNLLKRTEIDTAKDSYISPTIIMPFGAKFGSTKYDIKQSLGKPDYILVDSGIPNHQVFFYKKRAENYRYLLQIHFIDDKMIYAMNRFKTKDLLESTEDLFRIANLLVEKYIGKSLSVDDSIDATIVDSENNKIAISGILELRVRYISGDISLLDISKNNNNLKKKASKDIYFKNMLSSLMSFL